MAFQWQPLNRKEILRYLGYGNNQPDGDILHWIDICEEILFQKSKPRYVYHLFDLSETEEGMLLDNPQVLLMGNSINTHLQGCKKVILLAATLSSETDVLIRTLGIENPTMSLVVDACASAAVEQLCDMVEKEIAVLFPDGYLTNRFSPGYGDFSLSYQKDFVQLTDAFRKIGLSVTNNYLLIPIKSVTAVIGMAGEPIKMQMKSCTNCQQKEHCMFREKGGHCGN